MALHGDISVNGTVLVQWSAQRKQAVPREVNDYQVSVVDYREKPAHERRTLIQHRYDDGATALAAKVLAWASASPASEGGQR